MLLKAIECTQALQELGKTGYFTLNGNKIELDEQSLSDITSRNLDGHIKELLHISNFIHWRCSTFAREILCQLVSKTFLYYGTEGVANMSVG